MYITRCGKDGHSEDWCAYNPDNKCPYLNEKLKALAGTKPRGVLSEGNLTEKHGFSIHKVGRVVRFVSKTHRTLITYLHQNRPTIPVEKNFRYSKIQSYG